MLTHTHSLSHTHKHTYCAECTSQADISTKQLHTHQASPSDEDPTASKKKEDASNILTHTRTHKFTQLSLLGHCIDFHSHTHIHAQADRG